MPSENNWYSSARDLVFVYIPILPLNYKLLYGFVEPNMVKVNVLV